MPESNLAKSVNAKAPSKYEKPITSETVETLFRNVDFIREHLQYWTNLRHPGDSFIKRWITKALVNEAVGTHFDFVFKRDPGNRRIKAWKSLESLESLDTHYS